MSPYGGTRYRGREQDAIFGSPARGVRIAIVGPVFQDGSTKRARLTTILEIGYMRTGIAIVFCCQLRLGQLKIIRSAGVRTHEMNGCNVERCER